MYSLNVNEKTPPIIPGKTLAAFLSKTALLNYHCPSWPPARLDSSDLEPAINHIFLPKRETFQLLKRIWQDLKEFPGELKNTLGRGRGTEVAVVQWLLLGSLWSSAGIFDVVASTSFNMSFLMVHISQVYESSEWPPKCHRGLPWRNSFTPAYVSRTRWLVTSWRVAYTGTEKFAMHTTKCNILLQLFLGYMTTCLYRHNDYFPPHLEKKSLKILI